MIESVIVDTGKCERRYCSIMKRFDLSELSENAHIHFIGIGGISMSGLAQVMLKKGYAVTGSDRQRSHITDKLEKLGAKVFEGHKKENIGEADLVVYTAAVKNDNPELAEAIKRGIRVIDRAECLGAVMKLYKNAVGIAGTHGKTSTTSMLAYALLYADADPTISLGGELDLIGGNMRVGNSDIFVTEACEYTNSFLKFFPTTAVITNIEEDHLDFFSGIDEIKSSFEKFASLTKGKGKVIVCGDDENIKSALKHSELDIIRYGFSEKYDYYPKNIDYIAGFPAFDVYSKEKKICHIELKVPGEHNIKNALAAIAVSKELGLSPKTAATGICRYPGVHRRFEKKGEVNGAIVIDDYAHHPTEIKATLEAAKKFSPKRLRCVFQPHTYSRTKLLWNEFLNAFDLSDEIIVADIYAARELPDGETTSEKLVKEMKKRGVNAIYMDSFEKIAEYLNENLSSGEFLLTIGAGDIYKVGNMLIEK